MNFDKKLEKLGSDIQALNRYIEMQRDKIERTHLQLCKAYEECKSFTENFLEVCKKYGIDLVAINTITDEIESAKDWPFSAYPNVFADHKDEDGFPLIWQVIEDLKISEGCGNNGQHQIKQSAAAKMVDGVYRLKDGKWFRIVEEENNARR